MTDRTPPLTAEDSVKAAEYALGVLQGDARRDFARRVSQDPALAAAVRQWDEHFIALADEIAPVEAPLHVQAALEKRLFATGISTEKTSLWNSLWLWRGLTAASVAAVIAFAALNYNASPLPPASGLVAQVAGETNAVKLVAYYDEGKGELRLNRTEGDAASGRSFELWLIAGQDAPVSLGVLPTDATGKVTVPANLRAKIKGGVLAISDEPRGGSPTGAPTGAVLATGALTAV
jgi:anti-sigma-K factor RskA